MTHRLKPLERLRQHVAGLLHIPLSMFELYAARAVPKTQYTCTVHTDYRSFEAKLHHMGFLRNFISSVKHREYATEPERATASWVHYPDGALGSDQLHIGLFESVDGESTDIYSHWEPSWIRHPIKHYRAQNVDDEAGIERMRAILEEYDVEYTVKSKADRVAERQPTNPDTVPERTDDGSTADTASDDGDTAAE